MPSRAAAWTHQTQILWPLACPTDFILSQERGLTLNIVNEYAYGLLRRLLYIVNGHERYLEVNKFFSMSIFEQIKKVMEGKKKDEFITSADLKSELKEKFEVNISSVLPSDYCYNRLNDGISFKKETRLFEYLGRDKYRYLGENYPFTGKIYHRPYKSKTDYVVGSWVNGKFEIFLTTLNSLSGSHQKKV